MLLPIRRFHQLPVMSLQTGTELAVLDEPIIDPRKLTIVAFYVTGQRLEQQVTVLHVSDIRELSDIGAIVDGSDVLMAPDDLVRLQEVIGFHFTLIGTKVVDEHGRNLGKVDDYALEPASYSIQQIYTKPSLLRSFTAATNIIHRSQIVSVTNERIVVKSPSIVEEVTQKASQAFSNPFRTPTNN